MVNGRMRESAHAPVASAIAFIFGLLTLVSGATVLFGPEEVSQIAGEVVGFVLWFNFVSGPVYLVVGFGLWNGRSWSVRLSAMMVIACALVLLAFVVHVTGGYPYEPRTLVAMIFRTVFWLLLYRYAARHMTLDSPDEKRVKR